MPVADLTPLCGRSYSLHLRMKLFLPSYRRRQYSMCGYNGETGLLMIMTAAEPVSTKP